MRIFVLFLALLIPHFATAEEVDCHGSVACTFGDRSYHIREPDDWDGSTPLPVLLHFHGWQRQGDLIVNHDRISGATRRRGVLLVAPNGLARSWDWWDTDTVNLDFVDALLRELQVRYPIDPSQIFVSGYSFGGAMAWRYACGRGDKVAALLAISGSIPQRETCAQAPNQVRHVHGLGDTVMDYPFGPNRDATNAVALWRRHYECGPARDAGTWQQRSFLTLSRTVWDNCKTGQVTLDTHPGGHFIPHGWIARQLDELLGLPNSYP